MAHVLAAPAAGRTLRVAATLFDRLEQAWEATGTQRRLGTLLVVAFLASVAAIEANRQGWLPADVAPRASPPTTWAPSTSPSPSSSSPRSWGWCSRWPAPWPTRWESSSSSSR